MKTLGTCFWAWFWCFACFDIVFARNFSICREFAGNDFFDNFYFWKYNDPTKGKVDYVSQKVAQSMNLSYVNPATNQFVMQVDYMNDAVPINGNHSDLGRRSVRIHSNNLYGDGIYILKASFMPQGCGYVKGMAHAELGQLFGLMLPLIGRPAEKSISSRESTARVPILRVYILVKDAKFLMLHSTNKGQSISLTVSQQRESNCSYQPGCSTRFDNIASYGLGFNGNGGGYFALVRDTKVGGYGIGVWFWPMSLNASSIPTEVVAATKQAPTDVNLTDAMQRWGKPQAFFGSDTGDPSNSTNCPMNKIFQNHELVFDTTLCGYWGESAFNQANSCPNVTCQDFIINNGSQLQNARWEIDFLRIYSNGCESLDVQKACPNGGTGDKCSSALGSIIQSPQLVRLLCWWMAIMIAYCLMLLSF